MHKNGFQANTQMADMGPMAVKVLSAVQERGVAGEESWAQLDMVNQIVYHMERRTGQAWKGLVRQVVEA